MSTNQSIFTELHAPGTERKVEVPDGDGYARVYSNLAVGYIQGESRGIDALVSQGVTEQDLWYVVNLSNYNGQHVCPVAVLGATSEDQAAEWAIRQVGIYQAATGYSSCATTTHVALKRLLDRPSSSTYKKARINQADLDTVQAQVTGQPVRWSGDVLSSHCGSSADLMCDMAKFDDASDLLTRFTASDLPTLLKDIDADVVEYDALIVDYGRLELLMTRLSAALGKAAVGDVTITSVTQTKPFKKNGVAQVAAIFEMSDGQSVTIVFHNPDNTPSKLGKSDVLTSWKWLLNKRDVSAAVQPEQGKDVQLPQLAVRIMKMVNQNSARFKRTQVKKAENEALLVEVSARVDGKKQALIDLDAEISDLQAQIDAKVAEPPAPVPEPKTPPVGYSGVWDTEDGSAHPFLSVRPEGIASFATRAEAEQHYAENTKPPETDQTVVDSEGFDSDESAARWFSANSNVLSNLQSLRYEPFKSRAIINIGAILRGLDMLTATYQQQLADVKSGKVVGSKVVGSGYGRNTKSVAIEWVEEQIQKNETMIDLAKSLQDAPSSIDPSAHPVTPATNPTVTPAYLPKIDGSDAVNYIHKFGEFSYEDEQAAHEYALRLEAGQGGKWRAEQIEGNKWRARSITSYDEPTYKQWDDALESIWRTVKAKGVQDLIDLYGSMTVEDVMQSYESPMSFLKDAGNKIKLAGESTMPAEQSIPATNPDAEFFQSLIDGTIDPLDVNMDHVIELAEKYEGNPDMEQLIDAALEAINKAEQAASQSI